MSTLPTADAAAREAYVALRDGSTLRIRPVGPEDAPVLRDFFSVAASPPPSPSLESW